MKLCPQSVCQLAFLSLCCVLITVKQSDSTFVPGRCLCPLMQQGVRGQLSEFSVYPISPSCYKVTVIVTLKRNNEPRCLDPEAPMGRQLIRCWNRAQKLGRDVKLCLRRTRRRGRGGQRQQPRQRRRGHKKASSSDSQ
ncbi:C-X-C motif chemokine 10-like [Brachyistius frenatus]|uniref:C-X-C motif chemokine 10-like n=1 Tax=Brachyistius frenatus TaxID=100188 RepID=UPI0037E84F05